MSDEPKLPDDLKKQAESRPGGRFPPGQSGNPRGKKPGTKHRTTQMVEKLMGDQAEAVVQATIGRALAGSTEAQKLILDRLAPIRRDRPIEFDVPDTLESAADLSQVHDTIFRQVAEGVLTPSEAQSLAALLEARRRTIETTEIERRLAAIEAKLSQGDTP
ncbi:MAG: hypothetical protein JSS20_10350 [Proteobacteria bacterium]|nr:hypothetical protein [Pseudomonadota bacterium]